MSTDEKRLNAGAYQTLLGHEYAQVNFPMPWGDVHSIAQGEIESDTEFSLLSAMRETEKYDCLLLNRVVDRLEKDHGIVLSDEHYDRLGEYLYDNF